MGSSCTSTGMGPALAREGFTAAPLHLGMGVQVLGWAPLSLPRSWPGLKLTVGVQSRQYNQHGKVSTLWFPPIHPSLQSK